MLLLVSTALASDIWTSSSTYYRDLPRDSSTDDFWGAGGGVLWRYEGQQEFLAQDVDVSADLASDPVIARDGLSRLVRVDREGRRWEVAAVDEEALAAAAEDYARDVNDERSDVYEFNLSGALEEVIYEEADSGEDFVEYGWTSVDCDPPDPPSTLWEEEDRAVVAVYNSDEERSSLLVYENTGTPSSPNWAPIGTAVRVASNGSLLTAAHVITNGATPKDPEDVAVCTMANAWSGATCYLVDALSVSTDWTGSTAFTRAHDWGVIDIDWFGGTAAYLPLSSRSDSWLDEQSLHHLGHAANIAPLEATPCDSMFDFSPEDLTYSPGILLTRDEDGSVVATTSSVLRARVDSGPGASGGGIVAFSGGAPEHVGLMSGHTPTPTQWSGGPKTSAIRALVLALL